MLHLAHPRNYPSTLRSYRWNSRPPREVSLKADFRALESKARSNLLAASNFGRLIAAARAESTGFATGESRFGERVKQISAVA